MAVLLPRRVKSPALRAVLADGPTPLSRTRSPWAAHVCGVGLRGRCAPLHSAPRVPFADRGSRDPCHCAGRARAPCLKGNRMAIFHLSYRGCSPATGAGAVRKAAYQSGQALVEERTGELCDYARKERVAEDGLFLPAGVPPIDRGSLWNGAERAWAEGGGGNELVAKRYEFALPIELDACARRACVLDFCALFPAKACDWAIHDDGRGGNPHAHVLVSALDLGAQGFTQRTKAEKGQCFYLCQNARGVQAPVRATDWKQAKADGWEKVYNFKDGVRRTMKQAKAEGLGTKDRASKQPVQMHRIARQSARDVGSAELTAIRAAWAEIANRHLAAYAAVQTIDHRSNKDRGIEAQPTVHEGGAGLIGHDERVKLNKEIKARNERLRVLRSELKNEGDTLEQLKRELAELERKRGRIESAKRARAQGRHRGALAKRRRTAMATAAAAAAAQQRVAAAAVDQTDTRAELLVQLDEQIAALDLKIRQLQSGGTAKMLSGPLLKAAELGAERKKLADERNRLAGGGPAPRRPEPPRPEQNRPRGPRH